MESQGKKLNEVFENMLLLQSLFSLKPKTTKDSGRTEGDQEKEGEIKE